MILLKRMMSAFSRATLPAPKLLYKSDNFLCIDKTYDIKINSNDQSEMTVEHQLRKAFPELVDPKCHHGFRFVHRLDYATSGILCLGLNRNATKHLAWKFKHQEVTKYYLALVRGHVQDDALFINVPTGDLIDEEWPGRRCVPDHPKCSDARPTKTLVLRLSRGFYDSQPATKVLLKPLTGRTHQLRVHCDLIGHTIVGDFTYSLRQDTKPWRMMLHSQRLKCDMELESLNITSQDPFVGELIPEWKETEELQTYDNAVNFAQTFEPVNPGDSVKLVEWQGHSAEETERCENT